MPFQEHLLLLYEKFQVPRIWWPIYRLKSITQSVSTALYKNRAIRNLGFNHTNQGKFEVAVVKWVMCRLIKRKARDRAPGQTS